MKISVITPSYNDAKSIVETLNSLKAQTYENWESIIIDDGSTDNTKEVIEAYKKENNLDTKITYVYQENADQLNAIINGLKYIKGDYVFLLHSDDLLPSDDFFEKIIKFAAENKECEAFYGDLVIINEKAEVTNLWKSLNYNKNEKMPAILMLNHGANIYGDVGLRTTENLLGKTYKNYLTWNMPFWIDMDNNAKMINMKKYPNPVLKYRIHSENYANNEIGKFCALNGELRTLTRLMAEYEIKFYTIQKFIFKVMRTRGIRRLGLAGHYTPICVRKETDDKKKSKLIKKAIKNTYSNGYDDNKFLKALDSFYSMLNSTSRHISLNITADTPIYKGKDIRIFAKKLYNNQLPSVYEELMNQMLVGFKEIDINEEFYEQVVDITKFMCIYPYVKINKV